MVETLIEPSSQNSKPKAKVSIDSIVGKILDYLRDRPAGETVEDLARNAGVSAATVRKTLGIIAAVTSKVGSLFIQNPGSKVRLLMTRSPKDTVIAARFEVVSPENTREELITESTPEGKPTFMLGPADVAEVQRAWKLYKATGHAFRHEETGRIRNLCEKYPSFFTQNASNSGILPTMALFTVAKALEQYAALGRLPGTIETPLALFTFEGGM